MAAAEPEPRFELLTPPGRGGIAVVRVVGAGRWERMLPLLHHPLGRPLDAAPVVPMLLELHCGGQPTDQVLVVDRPERGELELHLHGSPMVLQLFAAEVGPIRPVAPTGVAARLLQQARNETQLALALEQRELERKGEGLVDLLTAVRQDPDRKRFEKPLRQADERSRVALALGEPTRLVICGRPNAGKSTVMNRLLLSDRVLTGATAGLTRDPVRDITCLGPYPYELVDTAGVGAPKDRVDAAAQEQGAAARRGELRLLVVDAGPGPSLEDEALLEEARNDDVPVLIVRNKMDLAERAPWPKGLRPMVEVTCLEPGSAPDVRAAIGGALIRLRGLPAAPLGPVGGPAALDSQQFATLRTAMEGLLG